MENHHFNGKIHELSTGPCSINFNSKLFVYQRVFLSLICQCLAGSAISPLAVAVLNRPYDVGPPVYEIAFSWGPDNSHFTMVYDTCNYSIPGVFKPTNIIGGAHIITGLYDRTYLYLGRYKSSS